MVGFGETFEEIKDTLNDLADIGCDIVTIGQYLQPTNENIPVAEYIPPEKFKEYEDFGNSLKITIGLTLIKIPLFFLHERIWKHIKWGKIKDRNIYSSKRRKK